MIYGTSSTLAAAKAAADAAKKEKYKDLVKKLTDISTSITNAETEIKKIPEQTKEGIKINEKSTTTGEINNTINDLEICKQRLANIIYYMKKKM